ncbi:glycosyltransferase family 25 protein [Bibersteinia trehalosi]|uniref:glycosyltransferase family 25 protein n=1 Tax=Bibersteinia trehalosi TaxID=47735 RepID=UPI004045F6A5
MQKYLISLDKDNLRRELFFSQPDTADFQIFSAFNTMSESEEYLSKRFELTNFLQKYGRRATKGEVGCTLSHLGVYQQIIQDDSIGENEFSLICEDDVLFHQDFPVVLQAILNQQSSADMILLGQSKIAKFNDRELELNYPTAFLTDLKQTGFAIGYPYKNYYAGTVSYLIRKSAARIFLQTLEQEKPFWLADDFILFGDEFGLNIQVVRPLVAIENPKLNSNLEALRGSNSHYFWQKLIKYPAKKLLAIKRNIRK